MSEDKKQSYIRVCCARIIGAFGERALPGIGEIGVLALGGTGRLPVLPAEKFLKKSVALGEGFGMVCGVPLRERA